MTANCIHLFRWPWRVARWSADARNRDTDTWRPTFPSFTVQPAPLHPSTATTDRVLRLLMVALSSPLLAPSFPSQLLPAYFSAVSATPCRTVTHRSSLSERTNRVVASPCASFFQLRLGKQLHATLFSDSSGPVQSRMKIHRCGLRCRSILRSLR